MKLAHCNHNIVLGYDTKWDQSLYDYEVLLVNNVGIGHILFSQNWTIRGVLMVVFSKDGGHSKKHFVVRLGRQQDNTYLTLI